MVTSYSAPRATRSWRPTASRILAQGEALGIRSTKSPQAEGPLHNPWIQTGVMEQELPHYRGGAWPDFWVAPATLGIYFWTEEHHLVKKWIEDFNSAVVLLVIEIFGVDKFTFQRSGCS